MTATAGGATRSQRHDLHHALPDQPLQQGAHRLRGIFLLLGQCGVELPSRRRNFAFADGSVRFLKDSISTWPFNPATGFPVGVADANGFLTLAPGTKYGVYQMLSSRNGGEVISSDQY